MGVEGNRMTEIARVTVNWTGFTGAPGFTNLYFRGATSQPIDQATVDAAITKVDAWLAAWQSRLPATVTVVTDSSVEVIEDTTGELQGFFAGTPGAARVGSGTGNYSAASGAVANWYTEIVRNGRRIRGRTFIVPVAGNFLATNGSLDDTSLTGLRTSTATFITRTGAAYLVVWGRPTTPLATDGVSAEVTAFTIPDKAAILTSRRD